jgi:hypothetical protein
MSKLSPILRAKIIRWARHYLVGASEQSQELHISSDFQQQEAFIYVDGADYYILADRSDGETNIKIKELKTLDDLPAMVPDEVPADVYVRLEQNTKVKKGWIRRSL